MHSFHYGTRVIENERTVSLESKMISVGNKFCNVVRLLVLFVVFCVVNALLSNLIQHISGFSFNTFKLLEEGFVLFLNDGFVSTFAFVYQNSFGTIFATCCCMVILSLSLFFLGYARLRFFETEKHIVRSNSGSSSEAIFGTVSYKYKVAFLS